MTRRNDVRRSFESRRSKTARESDDSDSDSDADELQPPPMRHATTLSGAAGRALKRELSKAGVAGFEEEDGTTPDTTPDTTMSTDATTLEQARAAVLKKAEIAISMDGKGAWRDNVFPSRRCRHRLPGNGRTALAVDQI